ncbi:large ribosomal subunit protein bL32m [Trichomonascus vanleenenianus]|uniref:mitochondrial 54S ribosomal protein bL32m MRPL32 n=1 Tax=Trichomonascus vanleenenianus TaxID=2268995 RepID=UPI003ECA6559
MASLRIAWSQGTGALSGLIPRVGLPSISITLRLPALFQDSGIVLAVPKKKTSHQKKRQRQLSPRNKINPLNNLNRCPACGNFKRAHTLCMHCVNEIKGLWKKESPVAPQKKLPGSEYTESLDPVDKRILYPGKVKSQHQRTLEKKEYLYSRPRTLPVVRTPKAPKFQRPRE